VNRGRRVFDLCEGLCGWVLDFVLGFFFFFFFLRSFDAVKANQQGLARSTGVIE